MEENPGAAPRLRCLQPLSPCCRDVSQLLPSAFPCGMSNGARITFNVSWGLSQLLILECFISRDQNGVKVRGCEMWRCLLGVPRRAPQEMHSVPTAASAFHGEGAL